MPLFSAALSGLIFGIGLIIAGMTDPGRILAFLDIAGDWNPALALVMVSAILAAAPAFARARRRPVTLLGAAITLPDRRLITPRLVIGAVLFGLGWGLAGICPGPALVLLGQEGPRAAVFLAAIVLGQKIADKVMPDRR